MTTEEEKKVEEVQAENGVKPEEKPAEVEAEKKEESKEEEKKEEVKERNIKFDASALPHTDDPAEIRKQVEFYFSDSNIRFDKFLFGLVGYENRFVPLKLIASFKRMQRFPNYEAIVSALETSEILEFDESKEKIRRKTPLPPPGTVEAKEIKDKAQPRSIYAKGFGEETPTLQYDIEKFFEPYGPVLSVRLRRDDEKKFKGSVFVEFESPEVMEKFMAVEPKPKFEDKELLIMTKKGYVEMKIKDINEGKIQPQAKKSFRSKPFDAYKTHGAKNGNDGEKREERKGGFQRGGRGGRGRGRGGRGRGGRDRNDRNGNGKRGREEGGEGEANGEKKAKVEVEASA